MRFTVKEVSDISFRDGYKNTIPQAIKKKSQRQFIRAAWTVQVHRCPAGTESTNNVQTHRSEIKKKLWLKKSAKVPSPCLVGYGRGGD